MTAYQYTFYLGIETWECILLLFHVGRYEDEWDAIGGGSTFKGFLALQVTMLQA